MKEKKENVTSPISNEELLNHPYLTMTISNIIDDILRHDSNLGDLVKFKNNIEFRVEDLEDRVAKLEQVKESVAQEVVKLPQDVLDFITAVYCCSTFSSISCSACPYSCNNGCVCNGARFEHAFELYEKYVEQK